MPGSLGCSFSKKLTKRSPRGAIKGSFFSMLDLGDRATEGNLSVTRVIFIFLPKAFTNYVHYKCKLASLLGKKKKAQGLRNASQCPGLLEKNTFLEKLMSNPQSREEKNSRKVV